LIEPNRSLRNRRLFSEYTKQLSEIDQKELIETYWRPHRNEVQKEIHRVAVSGERVIHLGIHTFTPVWKGKERDLEIGLLYDSKRKDEKAFILNWKKRLHDALPGYRIRVNRPYLGKDDGLTTGLRKEFSEKEYLGIEIEVNQNLWFEDKDEWRNIAEKLARSLKISNPNSGRHTF
jgi:predicted N-formylglutamate amidohydrolase